MAISLEELTAVALEGSVGPLTLAVGAGALAIALAAGPTRRLASTSMVAAGRNAQLDPRGWIGAARRHWSSLVEEARAEYEAGRAPAAAVMAPSVVAATATGAVPEAGRVVVPGVDNGSGTLVLPEDASRTRDRRGRFVRRATNGRQPE